MPPQILEALASTITMSAMTMLIVTGGTMFTAVFGGWMLTDFMGELDLSAYWLILAPMFIAPIAGMVLGWICIMPIFMPLAKVAGIDSSGFAVMFMVVVQTAYLTPPLAPSIFYLSSSAPPNMS